MLLPAVCILSHPDLLHFCPFCPAVLVKWKSVGLTALLEREREQQEALIAASGGRASKSRTADDLERLLVPFDA